jgi:hypothetical protein
MRFPAADASARSVSILLCCTLLCGCKLVDQRTFDRTAGRPPMPRVPAAPVARGPAPIPPLFVVHAGLPDEAWQPDLRGAVNEALARKPNALFTVESVVPVARSPAAQAAALQAAATQAGRPVADALGADGARPGQIEMSAAVDPAVKTPEVRIFVR